MKPKIIFPVESKDTMPRVRRSLAQFEQIIITILSYLYWVHGIDVISDAINCEMK